MLKKSLIIIGVTAAVSMVLACSGTETLLQRNWGKSHETAVYNQTLNPNADKTLKTVDALDGQAAEGVHKKYLDGFKTQEKGQATSLINLK